MRNSDKLVTSDPDDANQTNRHDAHVPIVIHKDTYQTMNMRQDDKLWTDNYR